jgi:hypothetical protein
MRRIVVKPVKIIAHAYLAPCINYPGVFLPYINYRGQHYCIGENAKRDLIVVDACGVVGRLVVTKVALQDSTFKAICLDFLYCTINDFRIWLVVC